MLNANKILVLDIETTGFLNQGGKIVEVGIVELCLLTGARAILFDRVCTEEGLTLEDIQKSWIVNNSDLSAFEIVQSPDLEEFRQEIQAIIGAYPLGITAYNHAFDFGYFENRGFKLSRKLACPMHLATNVVKLPNRNGYAGYKWPKVQEAFDFFFPDSGYDEQHRGADDAYHEAAIVYELYKRGVFKIDMLLN